MKHSILVIYLSFLTLFPSFGQGSKDMLRIKEMNEKEIVIGGEKKTVGDTFRMNESIRWPGEKGAIFAQNMSTKEYFLITQVAFESKSVSSLSDYILTCKASTRSTEGTIMYARNRDYFGGEKRIALLIGNSNYVYDAFLKNPIYDVQSVSSALVDLGFDTYSYYDCNSTQMKSAIASFRKRAKDYDVALFYYAGHGISWENRYYYIPVNVELETKESLNSCIEGYSLLEQLKSDDRITLVLLDACRARKRSWARGMEDDPKIQMEAPLNMAVVYSTTDGKLALDGDSDLSPFAEAFLSSIKTPGHSFSECTIDINKYLSEKTSHTQSATQSNSLRESFYFQPADGKPHVLIDSSLLRQNPSPQKEINSPVMDFTTPKSIPEPRPDGIVSKSIITFTFPEEQLAYGLMYYEGSGVKKDYNKAFLYLKPLADRGYSEAFFPVADMYHRGNGVKKDRVEAEKWYKKAAEAGNAQAKEILFKKF